MVTKNFKVLAFIMPVILVSFLMTSCEKEEDTIATITVVNQQGAAIQGATVRLFAQGSGDDPVINPLRFDTTGTTNGSGKVSFNFSEFYKKGQAGFAVLDIEAYKGPLEGAGLIKVEEEETTEETVVIE